MELDTRRPKMMRRVLYEFLWSGANVLLETNQPRPALDDEWVQSELVCLIFPEKRIKTQADVITAMFGGFLFGLITAVAIGVW